jgi:hypothetical protein
MEGTGVDEFLRARPCASKTAMFVSKPLEMCCCKREKRSGVSAVEVAADEAATFVFEAMALDEG